MGADMGGVTYYNEFKPEAAHMLRQLIRDGLIAPGDVDERSIEDVKPDELMGYTQCHFFAGIGGWSVALRLAGWPDDKPVWTGSCPCQPFSAAGKGLGTADSRHLWPAWFWLVQQCRPERIYGEQVAAAITHGWWDDVASDLESEGYACGAAVLPACSVGNPHKRDRLWFVGDAQYDGQSSSPQSGGERPAIQHNTQGADCTGQFAGAGQSVDVADAECGRRQGQRPLGGFVCSAQGSDGQANQSFNDSTKLEWLLCPDGKSRPTLRGLRILAHGVQHRAPILHAFGNAIVPELAAEFIEATE